MPIITIETQIDVPVEVCFDMAWDIELHCLTAARTKERAVGGITVGLIGLGDSVTFEAVHFGLRQRLSATVVKFERPKYFVDEMTRGAFQSMRHTHEFIPTASGTRMADTLEWKSPLGILGVIADKLFLQRYMVTFLTERNQNLKAFAERSPG